MRAPGSMRLGAETSDHTKGPGGQLVPGRTLGSEFEARIERRGGIAWVLAQLEAGRSKRAIAMEIDCGRWWFDRWPHREAASFGPNLETVRTTAKNGWDAR
jgi:hypothetical protein